MDAYEPKAIGLGQISTTSSEQNETRAPLYDGAATKTSQTNVRRIFSFSQMFCFALSYMASWEAIAT
ncbi:hypothetical protein LTR17_027819, partial [Elasticomyces elasticus]